jgi:hypothetical protein
MTERFTNKSPGALTMEQAIERHKKSIAEYKRQLRQTRELAAQGRGGDTEIAHVALGELVVPRALQNPEVMAAIQQAAADHNVPLEMLSVGSARNRINPNTGSPEFGILSGIGDWFSRTRGTGTANAASPTTGPQRDFGRDFPGANSQLQKYDLSQVPGGIRTEGLFNGPINIGRQATNPPNVNAFFNAYDKPITDLANEMNVPPNYLLGLAAHESGWGQKKNLFGFSDSTERPYDYADPSASIDAFRNSQWFSRLQNRTDPNDFLNELVNPKGGVGVYNPHKGYTDRVRGTIDAINRRRPIWEQTR